MAAVQAPVGRAPTPAERATAPVDARDVWMGAPNNGPMFILHRCNMVNLQVHTICIVTGSTMMNDRQARPKRRQEWLVRSTRFPPTALAPRCLVTEHNATLPPLKVEQAVETAGDVFLATPRPLLQNASTPAGGPFHINKIMVNVAPYSPMAAPTTPGSEYHLRVAIRNVLDCCRNLSDSADPEFAWQVAGQDIAFDLVGSGRLGYTAEKAAENVLAAIQGWFNDTTFGTSRRAGIRRVYLLCPLTAANTPDAKTTLVEAAWRRAWDRYVHPVRESAPILGDAVARMEQEVRDLQAAHPGLVRSAPGLRGQLIRGLANAGSEGVVLP